jgi:spore coat protein CotH
MRKNIHFRVGVPIVVVLLALILLISMAGFVGQATGQSDESTAPFYIDRVVTVQFEMTEEDWTYFCESAREEDYVKADMWYDGELIPDIALRPKGNSSLASTISSGSIRFSMKADLNFFNSARNLDGVKKLNFNNGWSDPSYMREMLSYEIFRQMGIPTPRASFVDLWVNDIHLGLYTMVEQVDQTFLRQHFADPSGNLYKPEMGAGYLDWTEEDVAEELTSQDDTIEIHDVNLGGARINEILNALGWDFPLEEEPELPGLPQLLPMGEEPIDEPLPDVPMDNVEPGQEIIPPRDQLPGGNLPGNLPQIDAAPPGGRLPGGGLPQQGMNPLATQFGLLDRIGLKTNENTPDHSALFRLLDVLNNEPDETFVEEIEKVLDVDQVLRFLAVSATLVHLDNYTGTGHNYYLYEANGKFTIIPWDLNMAFGAFNAGIDVEGIINFLIDEPTAGPVAERPLVARLLEVPEYLEIYHGYITELINGPFSIEVMGPRINEIAQMIGPYVKADTLKFYSNAAFVVSIGKGVPEKIEAEKPRMMLNIGLKEFVVERIASIEKQLAGELPSTNNGNGNGGTFLIGGGNNINRINPRQ